MSTLVIIILVMLVLSAFFSGMETAVLGLSPVRLVKGDSGKLKKLYLHKEKIIATCLIGNNIVLVAATVSMTRLIALLPDERYAPLVFLVQLVAFFIFGETLAKTIFRKMDLRALQFFYGTIVAIHWTLAPLSKLFLRITQLVRKEKKNSYREEIYHFVRHQVKEDSTTITEGLMLLSRTYAREVMTPLPEFTAFPKNITLREAVDVIEEAMYTRYPVYEERGDNIVGYITVNDLLENKPSDKISSILREPVFVPETLPADRLMQKMQLQSLSIVFVVSEYGTVIGLVSKEDLAEELVGDIISREQAHEERYIIPKSRRKFELDGNLDIDDFNTFFSANIEKKGFETLNGYIVRELGSIPTVGDQVETGIGVLTVQEADKMRATKIKFSWK